MHLFIHILFCLWECKLSLVLLLLYCVLCIPVAIVDILVEHGASVAVRNRRGLSPKQMAHNAHIATLLIQGSEVKSQHEGQEEDVGGKLQQLPPNPPLEQKHRRVRNN